jgi:hypothetical protein
MHDEAPTLLQFGGSPDGMMTWLCVACWHVSLHGMALVWAGTLMIVGLWAGVHASEMAFIR